jgi:hypothetical protein
VFKNKELSRMFGVKSESNRIKEQIKYREYLHSVFIVKYYDCDEIKENGIDETRIMNPKGEK